MNHIKTMGLFCALALTAGLNTGCDIDDTADRAANQAASLDIEDFKVEGKLNTVDYCQALDSDGIEPDEHCTALASNAASSTSHHDGVGVVDLNDACRDDETEATASPCGPYANSCTCDENDGTKCKALATTCRLAGWSYWQGTCSKPQNE